MASGPPKMTLSQFRAAFDSCDHRALLLGNRLRFIFMKQEQWTQMVQEANHQHTKVHNGLGWVEADEEQVQVAKTQVPLGTWIGEIRGVPIIASSNEGVAFRMAPIC